MNILFPLSFREEWEEWKNNSCQPNYWNPHVCGILILITPILILITPILILITSILILITPILIPVIM